MEKIVIGISDAASMKAVDWVLDRAASRDLEVTLVAAYDSASTPFSEVSALLSWVRSRIGVASPSTVVHLAEVDEPPAAALQRATADAELLVIGARHRGHLAAVGEPPALRLAKRSRCATVIIPDGWVPTRRHRLVVGLDQASSASAVEFAAREAAESGAGLDVVLAWTAPLPAFDPLVWIVDTQEQLRSSHRQNLEAAIERMQSEHPGIRVGGHLVESTPGAALRERAETADLVVIGTHRRGPIVGALLGSTARELLRDGTTPLCIVPMEGKQKAGRRSSGAAQAQSSRRAR